MLYSACIDMLFADRDFYDRVALAQRSGVFAIEFWKWSNKDLSLLKEKLRESGLSVSVFNLDSKDEQLSNALSRGILNAGRKAELIAALKETLPVYRELNASALILLVGERLAISDAQQMDNCLTCLRVAAEFAEREDVNLIVEPLNDIDRKHYFLPRAKEVFELVRAVGSPKVKVLLDLYHEQLMAGNLIQTICENLDMIGHIHVADVPGRHEPGTGEIHYKNIFDCLKEQGYANYVGFEFRSSRTAEETTEIIRRTMV